MQFKTILSCNSYFPTEKVKKITGDNLRSYSRTFNPTVLVITRKTYTASIQSRYMQSLGHMNPGFKTICSYKGRQIITLGQKYYEVIVKRNYKPFKNANCLLLCIMNLEFYLKRQGRNELLAIRN